MSLLKIACSWNKFLWKITFHFPFFVRTWFEARHFSSPLCYLLFTLVPICGKYQSHSEKFCSQTNERDVWFGAQLSLCFYGNYHALECLEKLQEDRKRYWKCWLRWMQNKRKRKWFWTEQKDVCKHWNVFHVDFNDLGLISFLHIIW